MPGQGGQPPGQPPMRRQAARYASRPTLAAGNPVAGPPGYPARNRFKALFPLGPNRVGRAAQAGHTDPNPAEDLSVPTHHALATPEGIRQAGPRLGPALPSAIPTAPPPGPWSRAAGAWAVFENVTPNW